MVPYERLNEATTGAIDVWSMLDLEDRARTLGASYATMPEEGYLVTRRPITDKAERVVSFLREIAKSITANLRGEPLTIEELVRDSHGRSARKGFWEGVNERVEQDVVNEKLLLIISELTEAMEEMRDGYAATEVRHQPTIYAETGMTALKPEGFAIELADAMIRIADLAGWLDIDLTAAIRVKAEFNETRPHKHGKQF